MRYSIIAAPIALAASVSAGEYATSWTTEIVKTLTTYCSSATSLSINGKIHTVTEVTQAFFASLQQPVVVATSATPVAVSSTPVAPIVTPVVSSAPVVLASSSAPVVILSTGPAAPVVPLSSAVAVAPYPVSNSTTLVSVGTASAGTASPSAPSASLVSTPATTPVTTPAAKTTFKGAADRMAASSFSLVALLGLAACLL
ncbi:MAG: hypothetical protein ALECFALPRED_001760 [Alectoria fallacina]|uniref:Uncharacterized protein n=1 Tax=Alectoria fallacina TaxID=1903189 RepID=A0A8H3FBG7_9LECA|nr:MAG: hypothetical protein ALECFALPRED_001760 [Alectoria fallacina]